MLPSIILGLIGCNSFDVENAEVDPHRDVEVDVSESDFEYSVSDSQETPTRLYLQTRNAFLLTSASNIECPAEQRPVFVQGTFKDYGEFIGIHKLAPSFYCINKDSDGETNQTLVKEIDVCDYDESCTKSLGYLIDSKNNIRIPLFDPDPQGLMMFID